MICVQRGIGVLIIFFNLIQVASAQKRGDTVYKYEKKSFPRKSAGKIATDLKKSIAVDDEVATALQYETLARELAGKGDYARAEENLKKSLDIHSRLNNTDQVAYLRREIAKMQEAQQKIALAIESYQKASNTTTNRNLEQVNQNDANRLLNRNNPLSQIEYAQSNVQLLEKEGVKRELVDAYKTLGNSQLSQKNPLAASLSFNKAIEKSNDTRDIADISKKLSDAVSNINEIDTAISVAETILEKARTQHDTDLQINQLQQLARLHHRNGQTNRARELQEAAYSLALKSRNTLKARDCLVALVSYDNSSNNPDAAITRYEYFLNNLEDLIKSDSSLVDAQLFEVTEGRIKDLEKEKELQLALISKKNTLNYILIGSVLAMLVLLGFIIRSFYAIRTKNKKIALQSLRREMNPHFIFNSLNSVNQYIAENKELEANRYLTSYSGLMRNVMEHSHKDFVTLSTELTQLREYLHLEHLRFNTQFNWELIVDDNLDTDAVQLPNMLLQPHLENAVWHGLRYKSAKGLLRVQFIKAADNELRVIIEDDGIGLSESQRLKTDHQKAHKSRGLDNTRERISLLNDLYPVNIRLTMEEIKGNSLSGTRVILQLILLDKI